ncbi:MAG: HD-GYP domain-containing protein [Gammaproteobacteria bacterium]|nr:HD-GYP domain-containing protein [Gammaproteobacteria bacterium]NND36664.1 HD-GYP domain-containing protein [Gammaproteobacteria bacterium]
MLAWRIAVVAVIVGAVFASITYFTQQSELQETISELALLQVDRFNRQALDILDRPGGFDGALIQEELENFSAASGGTRVSAGYFVLARVFDADGNELAQIADENHANLDAVNARVDTAEFVPLTADEHRAVTVEIDDRTYIGVAVPMTNSASEVVAQILGAFAVSATELDRLQRDVLRTVAYVIAIILVTAVAIYPIIGNLLSRMSRLTANLLDANLETMQVLGGAIAKRDSDTDAHNYRVTVYSVALAETIPLPRNEIQSLIKGALLHDVGKLGIRDNVLLKPGKLDEDEFKVMKTHVEHGMDITARASWLSDAQDVVGGHHEKFDGAGYPRGLAGRDIPVNARIFAIADVFDALTSRRPYKDPMSFDATMDILEQGRGSHFDPELLDAFAKIAGPLYEQYGGHDDDRAKLRLAELSEEYFRSDIAALMQ